MKTLTEINNYLVNALKQLNLASPELDALSAFIANGIYLDQSLATSIVTESNPATCILLNSAIKHALGKMYSVYRGKNLIVRVASGLTPTTTFTAYKYDTFSEMNGYKLVYANQYSFTKGISVDPDKRPSGIDLILCKEVKTGAFLGQSSYKFNLLESNVSEDLTVYKPGTATGSVDKNSFDVDFQQRLYRDLDEMTYDEAIKANNSDEDIDRILAITDTDYSVTLFNSQRFKKDTYYYYRFLPYLSMADMSNIISDINQDRIGLEVVKDLLGKFKFFNNFDISENELMLYGEGHSGSGHTTWTTDAHLYSALPTDRQSNIDDIFWLSSVKFTSNNMIKSTNDVLNKFKTTFDGRYENVVAAEETDGQSGFVKKITLYYIPKNYDLTESEISYFKDSIRKMQYNSQVEIEVEGAQKSSYDSDLTTWGALYLLIDSDIDVTSEVDAIIKDASNKTLTGDITIETYKPMELINSIQKLEHVKSVNFDIRKYSPQGSTDLVESLKSRCLESPGKYLSLTNRVTYGPAT